MNVEDLERTLFLFFSMALAICSSILCIFKFYFKCAFYRKRGFLFKNESVYTQSFFALFLLELFLLMVHPSPFFIDFSFSQTNAEIKVRTTYTINNVNGIVCILNLLFQLIELFKSSKYNSPRIQRINLMLNNRSLSPFLPVKNYIANHPLQFMLISFFCSIFFFSSVLIIIERPISALSNKDLDEWSEMFWYVIVSMTTIGYGDRVAKNVLSRFIIMILVIWGNFWSSIFLSSVYPYIQLNLREEKALNHIKRLRLKEEIARLSSDLIKKLVQLNHMANKKTSTTSEKVAKMNSQSFDILKEIRKLNKELNMLIEETNYFYDDVLSKIEMVVNHTDDQNKRGRNISKHLARTIITIQDKLRSNDEKDTNLTDSRRLLDLKNINMLLQTNFDEKGIGGAPVNPRDLPDPLDNGLWKSDYSSHIHSQDERESDAAELYQALKQDNYDSFESHTDTLLLDFTKIIKNEQIERMGKKNSPLNR